MKQNMPPCSTVHQLRSLSRMQQLPPSLPKKCFGPHDIKDCTKVKKAVQAWDSNTLSNHSNKGCNHMKGGSRRGYKQKTGQVFQGYEAYKPPFNKANFKPSYSKKFQSNSSNSNKQPWKKQANDHQPQEMGARRQNKIQGARGNYKGKAENKAPRTTTNASKPIT